MILALLQTLSFLIVIYYAAYALLELWMVLKAERGETQGLTAIESTTPPPLDRSSLPKVSILLPVCDELHVIERLIDAVCELDYPHQQLEIIVLDDSSDGTSPMASARVAHHATRGLPIQLLARVDKAGFKAGNLSYGITMATGDFIAVFDADFIPPPNFLLKTIPCFQNPEIGFLQTGIGYTNRDKSLLTRFQAMEMGHQQFVTTELSRGGYLGSLSGSSCVWRRECIEDVGGWNADTITEDVDIGYRAQFHHWKYVFLRDVVSLSELPETISAVRVQRDRWARGLIHNAFRHFRTMLSTKMSLVQRLHAVSLMCSSLLLASFYLLILLALPLVLMNDQLGAFFVINCSLFLLAVLIWGGSNFLGSRKGAHLAYDKPTTGLRYMLTYVALFLPLSLYYMGGLVQVALGLQGEFNRTPKGGSEWNNHTPRINSILAVLEVLTFLYSTATLVIAIMVHNYWIVLFSLVVCSGFGLALYLAWEERQTLRTARHPTWQRILITGATGAIGGAFARAYAAPGRELILQGRKVEQLRELAADCEQRGAQVVWKSLDLRDRHTLQAWLTELCAQEPIDLVLINAGLNINIGPEGQGECWEDAEALIQVNLLAAMAIVTSVLPAMRRRGHGQIALMSSLAGYFGLPVTPSYCASKAGIKAYGEALRGWLGPEGIRVNVVMPGYVESDMCASMPGPKPFLWNPERAVRVIHRGLKRDSARISFPFPLNFGTWWLAVLPAGCSTILVRWLGYTHRR